MNPDSSESNLEDRLVNRPCEEPPKELRLRILRMVEAELELERRQARGDRITWRFAAAMAACVLVGSALAGVGASTLSIGPTSNLDDRQVRTTEAALAKLEPDISPAEARRTALILLSARDLPGVPQPLAGSTINMMSNHRSNRADVMQ